MRLSKKPIKLYLFLALLSLLLSYAVSLNSKVHVTSSPVPGLSSEFVLAVSSGLFAGSFVSCANCCLGCNSA